MNLPCRNRDPNGYRLGLQFPAQRRSLIWLGLPLIALVGRVRTALGVLVIGQMIDEEALALQTGCQFWRFLKSRFHPCPVKKMRRRTRKDEKADRVLFPSFPVLAPSCPHIVFPVDLDLSFRGSFASKSHKNRMIRRSEDGKRRG